MLNEAYYLLMGNLKRLLAEGQISAEEYDQFIKEWCETYNF